MYGEKHYGMLIIIVPQHYHFTMYRISDQYSRSIPVIEPDPTRSNITTCIPPTRGVIDWRDNQATTAVDILTSAFSK
uniref:Uncharacterized protein n=1 Tax=Onchocerca volvulus TaxID=6282 RepID=A0A8R1TSE7_ONCVO